MSLDEEIDYLQRGQYELKVALDSLAGKQRKGLVDMKEFLGFLLFPVSAIPLLVVFSDPGMPPWGIWFDQLGMYFGMAMLASFTFFVILAAPCVVAGAFSMVSPSNLGVKGVSKPNPVARSD